MRDAELPAGCRAQTTCQYCAEGAPTSSVIASRTRLGVACIALCGLCVGVAGSWADLMTDAELRTRVRAHEEHLGAEHERQKRLELAREVVEAQRLAQLAGMFGADVAVVIDQGTVSVTAVGALPGSVRSGPVVHRSPGGWAGDE